MNYCSTIGYGLKEFFSPEIWFQNIQKVIFVIMYAPDTFFNNTYLMKLLIIATKRKRNMMSQLNP